jgi:hypothetical protein
MGSNLFTLPKQSPTSFNKDVRNFKRLTLPFLSTLLFNTEAVHDQC